MPASSIPSWDALLGDKRVGASLLRAATSESEAETLALLHGSIDKLTTRLDSCAIDKQAKIPEAVLQHARTAGLFGLTIDEAHGGLGLSLQATTEVIDLVARSDRSVAVMLGLHAGLGTRGIIAYGSSEQRTRWLPRLAEGALIAAFAATEAGAGSDLMAVESSAVGGSGGLRLRGQKCYVTNGGFAGLYTVLVRTPEHGGARAQSLVCLERGAQGLHVGPEEDKLGIRGSSAVTLDFDDLLVPDDQVLGVPGQGSAQCAHVLAWGRTLMSAGCLGIARAALGFTLTHVSTRRQFGRALSDFPLVQSDCAEMAARIYAMESLVRLAAGACDTPVRLEQLSIFAKVLCSESAFTICDRAIQLHGALGFLESTGLPRLLRDCRITRIFEGANDVLLVRTGAAVLATVQPEPCTLTPEKLPPELRECARACDHLLDERRAALSVVHARYGLSVMRKQAILWALGQAEVYLHAAMACLLRASAETAPSQLALAEHAIAFLVAEATTQLQVARDPRVETRVARAQTICDALLAPMNTRAPRRRFGTQPQDAPS